MTSSQIDSFFKAILAYRPVLPMGIGRTEKAWLLLHQPIARAQECGYEKVDTPVVRAWLFEHEQIQERRVDVFSRFAAAHMDRTWSAAETDSPRSPIFDRYKHEFGIVRFAQLQNKNEHVLEMSWGSLNGRGVVVDSDGNELRELWKA
jgi:hypothetical protein